MAEKEKKQNIKSKSRSAEVDTGLENRPVQENKESFPVIGLGASAGGLEALRVFFARVQKKSGMAYIVLVHTRPEQPTMLPDLLQKVTSIQASIAGDGEVIKPDHFYVVPPGKEVSIYQGKIQLLDHVDKDMTLPIDFLFRSLAKDQGCRAAGVVLSGMGTDGTQGLKEIKFHDGLVVVQNPESANYDGMPRSAISTRAVDLILAPEEMPEKLSQFYKRHLEAAEKEPLGIDEQEQWLNKIFALVRTSMGHDFSAYKKNTILRRIGRRMDINQISDRQDYLRFLRENPRETEALFREMLIGVTSFFREPEAFKVLNNQVLPDVFSQMQEDSAFRVWVPGCSTGDPVIIDPEVPIVGLSAHTPTDDEMMRFKNAGFDDYLAKPVNFDNLLKVMTRVLKDKGRPDQ